jgi:hypothetical protein
MKVSLNSRGLQNMFIQHVEKLVFVLMALAVGWGVYSFASHEVFEKTPEQLRETSESAQRYVLSTTWDAKLAAAEGVVPKDPTATVGSEKRLVDVAPFAFDKKFNESGKGIGDARTQPPLLAAQEPEAHADFGPVAYAARGSRPGSSGAVNVQGKHWAVITAVAPKVKQAAEYQNVFRNCRYTNPVKDFPQYEPYFEVERAEVKSDDPNEKLDFQPLKVQKAFEDAQEKWASRAAEVVHANAVDPALTFPLPPLVEREWGQSVAHTRIPMLQTEKPAIDDQDSGDEEDTDEDADEESEEEDESEVDEDAGIAGPAGGRPGRGGPAGGVRRPGARGPAAGGPAAGGPAAGGPAAGGPAAGGPAAGGPAAGGPAAGGPAAGGPAAGGPAAGGPAAAGGPGAVGQPGFGAGPGGRPSANAVADCLVRYFDFTVTPGKRYRYRIRLKLSNPNYGVSERHLADPSLGIEPVLFTEWSAPTPVVQVPRGTNLLAGGVKAGQGANEPVADIMIVQQDKKLGVNIFKPFKLFRGQAADFFGQDVMIVRPGQDDPELLTGVDLVSKSILLDLKGGGLLPVIDPKKKTPRESEPGELLVLDPDGRMVVLSELDQGSEFKSLNASLDEWGNILKPSDKDDEEDESGNAFDQFIGAQPGGNATPGGGAPGGRPGGSGGRPGGGPGGVPGGGSPRRN